MELSCHLGSVQSKEQADVDTLVLREALSTELKAMDDSIVNQSVSKIWYFRLLG